MKPIYKRFAVLFAVSFMYSQNLFAGEADIAPVRVESIAIIAVATGGHLPGNMEIKIRGGFLVPAGLFCSNTYITTKAIDDPGRTMLTLLLTNQGTNRYVRLRITDDPAHTAYPGRCSLQIVEIR